MIIESVWLKLISWRQTSELRAAVETTVKQLAHSATHSQCGVREPAQAWRGNAGRLGLGYRVKREGSPGPQIISPHCFLHGTHSSSSKAFPSPIVLTVPGHFSNEEHRIHGAEQMNLSSTESEGQRAE